MLSELISSPALVDRWGREHTYVRIAVTDRCNLSCQYCRPAHRQAIGGGEMLTPDEIYRLAHVLTRMGVTKIRLTGGEPTMLPDLGRLVSRLAGTPGVEMLALTTNGVRLAELANSLKSDGLQAINVSLDTLRPARFQQITGVDAFREVMAGISAALAAGFTPLKLNTVVIAGLNEDELLDFVEFARDKPVNVRFIEYMPFRGNNWCAEGLFTQQQMLEVISKRYALTPIEAEHAHTSKDYRIAGFQGTVSFITPLSADFCQGCNRLRLTADGRLKTCLFSAAEVNLHQALDDGAGDDQLQTMIHHALLRKPRAHPPACDLQALAHRSMIDIGG